MVFGAIRVNQFYSAPCRFFADDVPRSNRIIWYPAAPGALIYTEPTVFVPRRDFLDQPPPFEYEQTGKSRRIRKWRAMVDRWHFPGDHVDGDVDDFRCKSVRSKYPSPPPQAALCILPQIFVFGADARMLDPVPETFPLGIGLGAEVDPFFGAALRFGLATGFALDSPGPEVHRFGVAAGIAAADSAPAVLRFGLACGLTVSDTTAAAARFGVAAGLQLSDTSPAVEMFGLAAGIAPEDNPQLLHVGTAAGMTRTSPAAAAAALGTALGAKVDQPTPPLAAPFELGIAAGLEMEDDIETMEMGIAPGMVMTDPAPPVSPGASCTAAGVMAYGVTYGPFTVGVSSDWFAFSAPSGHHYIVTVTSSANPGNWLVQKGTCASPTNLGNKFGTDTLNWDNTGIFGSNTNGQVKLTFPLLGTPMTYIVKVDQV